MKKNPRRVVLKVLLAQAAAATALLHGAPATAQTFPERPIRLIVPYSAGGVTDSLARSLADQLRKSLGQAVVVENKPGGNTTLGAQLVAKSAPDGHTLLLATGATMVLNPLLYSRLAYNPAELAPVARVAVTPLVLDVTSKLPARNLQELIRYARANPDKLNYGSTGAGGTPHLSSLLLEQQAGLNITHVPYNGSSQVFTGILSGDVQFFMDAVGSSLPLIRSGKMRAFAVTSADRLKVLPDVPTFAESGYPEIDSHVWYGIVAPAKTPSHIIAQLNKAIGAVTAEKSFRDQFEVMGAFIPQHVSAAAFGDLIKTERDKWAPLIKAKNITLD